MPLFKFLRMDRLRRSLRDSFRKKKDHVPECSKPHQWQADEAGVRAGTCNFSVKYLGCVEVFESRGMQVCEEALKMLRNSRRRAIKGILYVTGDGLRVVDDETKGLIVDQTIEKVSFCAPDRNHEKGFSYICRDGTTRRWMCHGFLAVKDSGERLSHAVGCAFAACLERKQKRDKECGVTMTFDHNNSTFTRLGSFRQSTMTERMTTGPPLPSATSATTVAIVSTPGDLSVRSSPLSSRPSLQMQTDVSLSSTTSIPSLPPPPPASAAAPSTSSASTFIPGPPGSKPQPNPYAVERPHATPFMLQRQGSFRGFSQLNQTSPFKRQLSLRLNDLPSNLERQQRSMSLESGELESPVSPASPELSPRLPRNRLQSLPNTVNMSPIPESSPVVERPQADSISAMCQQVARGLSLLSSSDDPFSPTFGSPPGSAPAALPTQQFVSRNGVEPIRETNPWVSSVGNSGSGGVMSRGELWLATNVPNASEVIPSPIVKSVAQSQVTKSASNPLDLFGSQFNGNGVAVAAAASTSAALPLRLHSQPITALAPPRKAPHIAHLRSQSLGAAVENSRPSAPNSNQTVPNATTQQQISSSTNWATFNGSSSTSVTTTCTTTSSVRSPNFRDPFDADWATVATSKPLPSTNPFAQGSVKTFEVHM